MKPTIRLIDVSERPFAEGASFGETGSYRLITGRVQIRIAPDSIGAEGIYQPDVIQRGTDGLIGAEGDIFILAPTQPENGNGTLLCEFCNRGNKRALQFFNDGAPGNRPETLADAGNGWLMRNGYALTAIAWQGDVLRGDGRLTAALPGFTDDAPTRITAEFIVERDTLFLPLSTKTGTRSSPAVSTDNRGAVLTRRRYAGSPREVVPNHLWAFERIDGDSAGLGGGDIMAAEQAIVACPSHIHMFEGFRPGWIYELEYDAHKALALDMGFVLLAETMAWLRHDAASPLRVRHTIGWGRSQSGRAIRDFIWRGFNRDHSGRRVFDGMLPHISGGGKTNMNRFSNLVVAASRQHEDHLNPSDGFPFSYARSTDHLTGQQDAILKRGDTDPLVIHTQTASEYWHRRGSLVHTDTAGNDLPQPDGVRIHLWSSSQHWSDTRAATPVAGHCRDFQNNVVTDPFFAGTLAMMHRWIALGVAPPPSQIPTRADGTLITVDDYRARWPAVPGAILPRSANRLFAVDYGLDFHLGAAPQVPPKVNEAAEYAVLVPAPDEYGNDAAGLRAPMVEVPLGTYTGWSIRRTGHGHGALFSFMGSYFPFPETPEEAAMTSDPRPAIVRMFPTADDYARAVAACVERLQHQGFIDTSGAEKYRRLASDYGAKFHVYRL